MNKAKTIRCHVGDSLIIELRNVREVYGHDDSLPFNADLYVANQVWGLNDFNLVGRAWNDGWGGDTVIDSINPVVTKVLDMFLRNNYKMVYVNMSWKLSLEELVTYLACLAIDKNVQYRDILEIDGVAAAA